MKRQDAAKCRSQRDKVRELYRLIGKRGLFVSSNYDVFTEEPEQISVGLGSSYTAPLATGGESYTSPLLFSTLTALLNHGTMLLHGAPGIGKTTSAEYVGHFIKGTDINEILAAEIQGHPQQTEEKMVASYDLGKLIATPSERVVVPARFLKCNVRIIDEGNRLPPDTLSIIMRLADTGKAVYGGELLEAEPGPLYITANYADEGTFRLTPPFLDRFDCAVMVTSPNSSDLRKIRERGDEKMNGRMKELLEIPEGLDLDFKKIRSEIQAVGEVESQGVPEASTFADFFYGSLRFSEQASTNIYRATKGNAWAQNNDNAPAGHFGDSSSAYTLNELSVRTMGAIHRYARAYAWFTGKDKVSIDDMKRVMPYMLWHKVLPSQKALGEEGQSLKWANDRIGFIESLIKKVETEYVDMLGSDAMHSYAFALSVIGSGKSGGKKCSEDEIRRMARSAIENVGNADRPWSQILASHISAEYNARVNSRAEKASPKKRQNR